MGIRFAQVYFPLKNILAYFKFMEDTDKELEQNVDFDWYLMLLAVAPKHQRQGYGSRFMTEGIEPFLEGIKGKKLAFLPIPKEMSILHQNGYKEVYSSEISFNQVEMGSWYFLKELKNTKVTTFSVFIVAVNLLECRIFQRKQFVLL